MKSHTLKYFFKGFISDPVTYLGLKVGCVLRLESINNEYVELLYISNSRIEGVPMFKLIYFSSNNLALVDFNYYNNIRIVDKIELISDINDHLNIKYFNIKNNREKLADIIQKYLDISDEELELADISEIERNLKLLLLGVK